MAAAARVVRIKFQGTTGARLVVAEREASSELAADFTV